MIRTIRRFWLTVFLWKRAGLPLMAAVKSARRYHRRRR